MLGAVLGPCSPHTARHLARPSAPVTRGLRSTQYLSFVSLGIAMSLVGPLLPAIRLELPMSYLEAGLILSGQFLGMVVTVPPGGHLADRLGKRAFLIASAVLMVAGLAGLGVARSLPALLAASVVTGVGGGGVEVGVNALEADHAGERAGHALNLLHFFFGLGAIAGPLLAAAVIRAGLGWRLAFQLAAALPALVALSLAAQPVSRGAPPAEDAAALYRSGTLWRYGLALAAYVAVETSVYGWIASYWERRGSPALPPPALAALFWATLTAGRLLCGRLADRLGLARFVRRAAAASAAVCLAWAALPTPAVTAAAVLLLGLSLAGIFPTTVALVTGLFPGHSGKVVAVLGVFASLGGLLGPVALGRLADAAGIRALPPFAAALAVALLAGVARRARPPT